MDYFKQLIDKVEQVTKEYQSTGEVTDKSLRELCSAEIDFKRYEYKGLGNNFNKNKQAL